MDKTRMTLRLPAELADESSHVAEQLGISLNAFVVLAVRNWTTYQRKQLDPPAARSKRPDPVPVAKVGPNQPCPCGSGQKYKRCHGKPGT